MSSENLSSPCTTPKKTTNALGYINEGFEGLENALIQPTNPMASPFVKYVMALISNTEDNQPFILSKGFIYYLTTQNNLRGYVERHRFATSKIFGSFTAISHSIPALYAIKEASDTASLANVTAALDTLLENPTTGANWLPETESDAAWSKENADKIAAYVNNFAIKLRHHITEWGGDLNQMNAGWDVFVKDIYQEMINTFFLALLSEAKLLFNVIESWKKKHPEMNWKALHCAIGFTTDAPLSGKPGSDFSINTSAEYFLMKAFMLQTFEFTADEIETFDERSAVSGTSDTIRKRIFCLPTGVPGMPSGACPSEKVDTSEGDKSPNSILFGSSAVNQFWATYAQRKMANDLFPNSKTYDDVAEAFNDLLRRPEYGLRYTFVKSIAQHFVDNKGSIDNMGCPYAEELW